LSATAAHAAPFAVAIPDSDILERVTRASAAPARVDEPTAAYFERPIAGLRRAEDAVGGVALHDVARAQLSAVVDLALGARGPMSARLVRLGAQYSQMLGWIRASMSATTAALWAGTTAHTTGRSRRATPTWR
jgi:hypothetical protein